LVHLNLATCSRITGESLAELSCDKSLRYLALGEGFDEQYLPHFQRFTNLRRLYLSRSLLTDRGLNALAGHPSIREIYFLTATSITDESGRVFATMPRLESLRIYHSKISKLSSLAGCRRLRELHLTASKSIDDAALRGIEELQQLEELDLRVTNVKGANLGPLQKLPQLRILKLAGCPVDDAAIEEIAGIHSLKWINLNDTAVTDEGKARLQKLRPDLQFGEP
jgi:hypothetical protein